MGLRVGVAGTGHLGREHVRILASLGAVDEVLAWDPDARRLAAVCGALGARACESLEALVDGADAVCVVAPTRAHADVALAAIDAGCDVFVEKPLAAGVERARAIVDAAARAGRILQVGHVERFNGTLRRVADRIRNPLFIEVHRLAPFTPRGADVSVVDDLMIHDLDLLGHFLGEDPVEIRARGAAVLTSTPDIVNARLEYAGGCVANVTASRVTLEPMRKIRVFSPGSYLSIDLLAGRATCYRAAPGAETIIGRLRAGRLEEPVAMDALVRVETISGDGSEPLRGELETFCRCVAERTPPPVTGEDGLRAVRLAARIMAACESGTDPAQLRQP